MNYENISENVPFQRLTIKSDEILKDDKCIGFVIYYPVSGIIHKKNQMFLQLNFQRVYTIFDASKPEDEEYLKENSLQSFTHFYHHQYVTELEYFQLEKTKHSDILWRFHYEFNKAIVFMKNILKIEDEKIIEFSMEDSIVPMNPFILNEVKKEEVKETKEEEEEEKKVSIVIDIWNYPGYDGTIIEPSPWKAFASHLDSPLLGGYCKGQFDGHFNQKAFEKGVPYGIVKGNGNRDKFRDLIYFKIVTEENEIYPLLVKLLQSSNSFERIHHVKSYLDSIGKTYDDESFWIKEEGKKTIKQSFFKAVLSPLIQKTPLFIKMKKKD